MLFVLLFTYKIDTTQNISFFKKIILQLQRKLSKYEK